MSTITPRRDVTEMETYSGGYLNLLDPQPEQITLADIAVGLSNACRFGNQIPEFYSVAEHSVRCAEYVADRGYEGEWQVAALFHDAHEAYTGDITAPLKQVLGDSIREVQARLDRAIADKFNLNLYSLKSALIKEADDHMLFVEAATLKRSKGIGVHWGNDRLRHEPLRRNYAWRPLQAEMRFVRYYEWLR